MKLLAAVVDLSTLKTSAYVEDSTGKRRRVECTFMSNPVSIPADWIKTVETEVSYQMGEEADRAAGRFLFR